MTKNVTAADVVQTGGTAKSPTMVLHYYGDDGSVWKIGNLAAKLTEETRNKLKAIKKGDTVGIDIKKEGNFWNLIAVVDAVANTTTSAAKKTTYTKSTYNKAPAEGRLTDVERAEGMQRGNVLTNAVNMVIASGKTGAAALTEVERIARRLLEISNSLENISKNEAELATQTEQDLDDPEVTQELGF